LIYFIYLYLYNKIMPSYTSHTRIFLDGSDTNETKQLLEQLGFLHGQTTNPSNFVSALKKERGEQSELKFERDELLAMYKQRVQEISKLIPDGSVSIEVYADPQTTAVQMMAQAREMFSWISNAHIKLPTTTEGLTAAEYLIHDGVRVNMTLCFSQAQGAAVYAATKGAKRGDVFISPFIGRLSKEMSVDGMDLVKNLLHMYKGGDGHVEVLAASIHGVEQLEQSISVGSDILTSYYGAIAEWGNANTPVPPVDSFSASDLKSIAYEEIDLNKNWKSYTIHHKMTDEGLIKFANAWNGLIKT